MKVTGLGLWVILIFIGWTTFAKGGELTHKWKSPSFSGIGSSAHFLTIENQEFTRKAEIRAKKESEEAKQIAAAKNTNYAKFVDNWSQEYMQSFQNSCLIICSVNHVEQLIQRQQLME